MRFFYLYIIIFELAKYNNIFFKSMKKTISISIICLFILVGTKTYSQNHNPLEKRYNKLILLLNDQYPQVKYKQFELTIFSHKKCGRCKKIMELLREKKIPMIVYDLKIPKYGNLMRNLCYKKADSKNIGIHYPVVVLNNNITYKIYKPVDLVNEIESKYLDIQKINSP